MTFSWITTSIRRWHTAIRDQTHVHVFNVHLCFLLQLHNNIFVEPLELWREKKTPTSNSLQHPSSFICAVLNVMHSWVTWLRGEVTIREERPGGMYDNAFLRGRDSYQQWRLISLLWLKIYNFPHSQGNYKESRTVLETCLFTFQAVLLQLNLWRLTTF